MPEITDAEFAELQRKAHAFDSEQGRLQKAQNELEAERTKRAELEARMAQQRPPTDGIDPRAAEVFGADGVTLLQGMLAPVLGKLDTIGRKFEERDTAESQARAARAFQDALGAKLADENLPGFHARLFGGDLSAAWARFVEARPSVKRAQADGDVTAVSDVIPQFIHQNKELVTGAGFSPSAIPGAAPTVKSEYTEAEYFRDVKVLERQLNNCAIDEAAYKKQAGALYDRWVAAQEKAERSVQQFGLA